MRSALVLALTLVLAPPSTARAAPSSLADLRPGQPLEVRTVFVGDSVETFSAVLVGVMPGGRSEGDLILARATDERVLRSGVAQGMSGSPVYADGRLIGALSSGWAFSREPVFGITPIAEMQAVLAHPDRGGEDGTVGPTGVDPGPRTRFSLWTWEGEEPTAVAPRPSRTRPGLTLPLAVAGANPGTLDLVRDDFAPLGLQVVPGGRAVTPSRTPPFVPGSACAVEVMRGDLNMAAIGTVTWVEGDRVLLFGHPFFQSGDVRLPLSTARITTVLGSLNMSFKLGLAGRAVGTVTQDRRAAVAGRLGPAPALMPLRVTVRPEGGTPQRFAFECVDDRALLPQLVNTAVLNSVLESGGTAPAQSVRWTLAVSHAGRTLRVGDAIAGDAPLAELAGTLVAPLRFLLNNPFARFRPDSVAIEVEVLPGRRQATLRNAVLTAPSVRPGGIARVRVELERWRGGRETIELEVPVPDDLPDGRYPLQIAGGVELDRAIGQRLPARFRAASVAEAMDRFATFHRGDAVHALLWGRASEVSMDGVDLPELPASAAQLLAPVVRSGDRARPAEWAVVVERANAFPTVVRGDLTLDLIVDRRAP